MDLRRVNRVGRSLRSAATYGSGVTLALGISGMTALYISNPAAFQTLATNMADLFNSVSYEQDDTDVMDEAIQATLEEVLSTPPEDIVKDPLGGAVIPQSASSVGENDDRDPAYLHQTVFNPVGELSVGCTATYVEIEDHQALNNGRLFVTAAHCLRGGVMPVVHGNYTVEVNGQMEERSYTAEATEVWEHPFYQTFKDEVGANDRQYTPYDIAMFRVDFDAIPIEVDAANLHVIDFSNLNESDLHDMEVSSMGYSADREGLTYHQNCSITDSSFRDFQTDCDISGGASGGNVTLPFDPDGGEPLTIMAINGGTHNGTENARHSFFEANMLNMIPFVVPVEDDIPMVCAQVTTNSGNLNRRFEPNTEGRPLSSQEREHFGALPRHSLVEVFGSINGWDLVRPMAGNGIEAIDQQFGYSSAQFLTRVPCPGR